MPRTPAVPAALTRGLVASALTGAVVAGVATGPDSPAHAAVGVPAAAPAAPAFGSAIDRYPFDDWNAEVHCDPVTKPGIWAFRKMLLDTYSWRRTSVARKCVAGKFSGHYEGRALDWGVFQWRPQEMAETQALLDWLLATDEHGNKHAMARRLGIYYIVWDNQFFGLYDLESGWREYASCQSNPAMKASRYDSYCHRNHVHFSFTYEGANKQTSFWNPQAPMRPDCVADLPTPAASAGAASASAASGFVPLKPARLVDTRSGLGMGAACVPPKGATLDVQVAGKAGVPSAGVTAAVLNITAVDAKSPTWVGVYPHGASKAETSVVNLDTRDTTAASVIVPVGADGAVSLQVGVADADLVVDVTGYFTTSSDGAAFEPLKPVRAWDRRMDPGAWTPVAMPVPSAATAVAVNVVGDQPSAHAYLAGGAATASGAPEASALNPAPGRAVANRAILGVNDRRLALYANQPMRVVADVAGWFGPGASTLYRPVEPYRVADSRLEGKPLTRFVGREAQTLKLAGDGQAIGAGAKAAAVTLTVVGATEPTWLAAWESGTAWPGTADVNAVKDSAQSNLAIVPLNARGELELMTHAGEADVVVDVLGYFADAP